MGITEDDSDVAAEELADRQGRYTARSAAHIGSLYLFARAADRVAAFAQILVVAVLFGANPKADLYFLAAIVPLTIGTVSGDPLGRGFLGLLVRERRHERAVALAAAGLAIVVAALAALTLAYLGVVTVLVKAFTPAGSGELGPWLAFAPIAPALGASAYLASLLLWRERYGWAAARFPAASVPALVLLAVAGTLTHSVTWVAVASAGGYCLGAAIEFAAVSRSLGPGWPLTLDRAALGAAFEVRKNVISPFFGGLLGGQVIVLLERTFAATLGAGGVSTLAYARGIAGAPAFVSQALGASVFPGLVRAESAGSTGYMRRYFFAGLRISLLLGGVVAVYLALYGTSLSDVLLRHGAFESRYVHVAGSALTAFSLSALGTSVIAYSVDVLYGIGRFVGVFVRSLAVFAAYLVFAPVLLVLFRQTGLALAFSFAQTAGAILSVALVAHRLAIPARDVLRSGLVPVVPSLALVAGVLGGYRLATAALDLPLQWQGEIRVGGSLALLGLAVASLVLKGSLPEFERLRQALRSVRAALGRG